MNEAEMRRRRFIGEQIEGHGRQRRKGGARAEKWKEG